MIPAPSRPPLSGDREADVLVIGGGMTGSAAALFLARAGRKTILLEAGSIGSGASGRNFGHIATGLGCHYEAAIHDFGRDEARLIWETHRENHTRLRELMEGLGAPCGYARRGGFSLAKDREEAKALAESEDLLREDGFSGEFFDHYMLESRFAVTGFAGGYWSADDAEVDGLALTRALAAAAERAGATIFEASPARELSCAEGEVVARVDGGTARAPIAVVALNAFVSPLAPFLSERIRPLRGQCVALARESGMSVPSPAYAEYGRVYWRLDDDRLLVGGFDDLDFEHEATDELGTTPLVQDAIVAFAQEHLGITTPNVLARWSGIMGISLDGFPFIGPLPDSPLVAAAGFTGLGFGYALLAARWASEYVLTGRDQTPARYRAAREFRALPWPPWNP